MRTGDGRAWRRVIPNWSFENQRVMADTHRLVAAIERKPHYAAHLRGLVSRPGDRLELVRDAVGVFRVSLSTWEHTARQVVAEIAAPPRHDGRSASPA